MSHYVEIATKPLLKIAFPEQTTFFSTYHRFEAHNPAAGSYSITASSLPALWRSLKRSDLQLVLCEPSMFAPWSAGWFVRAVFDRRLLSGHCPLLRAWGPQILRLIRSAPLAVVDHDDFPLVNRNNLWLLRRACVYLKRELPVDHWRLFMKTAHSNLPSIRFRKLPGFAEMLEKIRPISLGLPTSHAEQQSIVESPKEVDIFFAGQLEHSSTIRQSGAIELRSLSDQGISVDMPDRRVSPDEFRQRMSRAWLTWSPEGLGWDCFRHYEALNCGSVPVINSPTIKRYQPLREGLHAFFYHAESGNLGNCVRGAISNKAKLQQMSMAGRAHVLQHHTQAALAHYIVNETLAR